MDTLLLNSDGSVFSLIPLSVLPWQEAIRLVYLDKVSVIENYDKWQVHSQKQSISVPAIVMTKKYCSKAMSIRYTRQNLLYRDNFQCQYCGKVFDYKNAKELTVDHYVPKSMGGKKVWENTVIACKKCNHSRGNDFKIKPLKKPHKPSYYELVSNRKKHPIFIKHKSWNIFMGWDEKLLLNKPPKNTGGFNVTGFDL